MNNNIKFYIDYAIDICRNKYNSKKIILDCYSQLLNEYNELKLMDDYNVNKDVIKLKNALNVFKKYQIKGEIK